MNFFPYGGTSVNTNFTQFIPQSSGMVSLGPCFGTLPTVCQNNIGLRGSLRSSFNSYPAQYPNFIPNFPNQMNYQPRPIVGNLKSSFTTQNFSNFVQPMKSSFGYGYPIQNGFQTNIPQPVIAGNALNNSLRRSFSNVMQHQIQTFPQNNPIFMNPNYQQGYRQTETNQYPFLNYQNNKQIPSKGGNVINDLELYQAELKSVKEKIDDLYSKAIERSKKYIEEFDGDNKNMKVEPGFEDSKVIDRIKPNFHNETEEGDYEGEVTGDRKHGNGRMTYKNGLIYQGSWFNDQKQGFGVLSDNTGKQIYSGDWQNDAFHGKGFLTNLNATPLPSPSFDYKNMNEAWNHWVSYEGEFFDGKMEGKGILNLSNGDTFNGKFKDGMVNGEGCFYKTTGEVILGIWEENVLIHHL